MAASYSTGTATSPTDLLQKLVTWLVAQGWTQDASAADASGWRAHLHKSGLYVNLRSSMNETIWNYQDAAGYGIGFYLGSGYSGASSWKAQAGGPVQSGTSNTIGAGMRLGSGAITGYRFFDDGNDQIVIVVEKSPGIFVHMGWGPTLTKVGYSSAYPFFFGSSSSYYNCSDPSSGGPWPGHESTANCPMAQSMNFAGQVLSCAFVKVDAAVFSAQWVSNGSATTTSAGYTGGQHRCALEAATGAPAAQTGHPNYAQIKTRAWQTQYPGALLLPLHNFVAMASGRYAPIGYPSTVFFCAAFGHGFAAGETYFVGSDLYMIFPNFVVKKAA